MPDSSPLPMELACPDWSGLDTLWRHRLPFALWPVGGRPLLADWLDEAVRRKSPSVILHVVDRPAEIRAALEGGQYWSVPVEVRAVPGENAFPAGAIRLTGLAATNDPAWSPDSPVALLDHWFGLQRSWLQSHGTQEPSIYHLHPGGAMVGPRVRLDPGAQITPPVWIGARTTVESGVMLGPDAFVGEDCLIGEGAGISRSVILPSSAVGSHLAVDRMLIDGGCLVDMKRGLRLDIQETFILGKTGTDDRKPGWIERAAAALAWLALAVPARLAAGGGPMILRRHAQLAKVAAGQHRWIGVLPRDEAALDGLPEETADRIRGAAVGIFSLADAHGVHSTGEPEEWIHAACQAIDPVSRRLVRAQLWRLAWKIPTQS